MVPLLFYKFSNLQLGFFPVHLGRSCKTFFLFCIPSSYFRLIALFLDQYNLYFLIFIYDSVYYATSQRIFQQMINLVSKLLKAKCVSTLLRNTSNLWTLPFKKKRVPKFLLKSLQLERYVRIIDLKIEINVIIMDYHLAL